MYTAALRCFSIVVLLLALTGCGSNSKPPARSDNSPILQTEETKAEVNASKSEKAVEIPIPSEEESIAAIEKLGGRVDLSEDGSNVDLRTANVSDAVLVHLRGLTNLQELNVSDTKVSDAGLEHLMGLTKLTHLYLNFTQVSDDGLEHIKGLTNLVTLVLDGTQVSDAGLRHLNGLTNLRTLYWTYPQMVGALRRV
ncbi:MAG: leucine-rich repeat domain-containing protein [Planctomycetaceae bacterium]